MKVYQSREFKVVPATVDNFLSGELKPIFELKTKESVFRANTLSEALNLWRISNDDSEILEVTSCG